MPDGSVPALRKKDVVSSGSTLEKASVGKYTWQEVAKHSTEQSAWVIIDREVYDVTEFLDKHPGGKEMLLLAAGRDCTDLFASYHWWDNAEKAKSYMKNYHIGPLVGPDEFPVYAKDKGFFKDVSQRVRKYFEDTKQHPKDAKPGLIRLVGAMAFVVFFYCCSYGILFPEVPTYMKYIFAFLYGVAQVMPWMHTMHDASHAAIGPNEKWWKGLGRFALDWFGGGCMISWHHQHIVGHHIYTNIQYADPDVPFTHGGDPRYIFDSQAWSWVYKFQWIYLPILYGVLTFSNRITDLTSTWADKLNGPIRVNFYGSLFNRMIINKLVWIFHRIYIPLYVLNVPTALFWKLFFITELTSGYWLVWNFEVSHVTDTAYWPKAHTKKVKDAEGNTYDQQLVDDSWAVSQIKTSVSYGHDSALLAFFTGALNYQVEHHLFPGISQYHYPAVAPIVKQACKDHGIDYVYEDGFWDAWVAHLRKLKIMSDRGERVHVD